MKKTNYMMSVEDVVAELGVSKQNAELEAAGFMTVQAKIPRTYWSERFYTGKQTI